MFEHDAKLITISSNATIHVLRVRMYDGVAACMDVVMAMYRDQVMTNPWHGVTERLMLVAAHARGRGVWLRADLN